MTKIYYSTINKIINNKKKILHLCLPINKNTYITIVQLKGPFDIHTIS